MDIQRSLISTVRSQDYYSCSNENTVTEHVETLYTEEFIVLSLKTLILKIFISNSARSKIIGGSDGKSHDRIACSVSRESNIQYK